MLLVILRTALIGGGLADISRHLSSRCEVLRGRLLADEEGLGVRGGEVRCVDGSDADADVDSSEELVASSLKSCIDPR